MSIKMRLSAVKFKLRKIKVKLWYDQKKAWDKIAISFMHRCDKIIDVGCGEGRFIEQDRNRITGVDLSDISLNKCKLLGYNVIKADARKLPFENCSVDGIHCSHVVEHFQPEDVHKILSEFDRVLVPNGILAITAPLLWYGFYSNLTHVRPYNPEAILHYLTPSKKHTFCQISDSYKVLCLKKRFGHIESRNIIINMLTRLGFPWLKRTGFMLILKKGEPNREKNI
jgi:ubiquinone/menaquinone biosynthesis C-methylase UbiE